MHRRIRACVCACARVHARAGARARYASWSVAQLVSELTSSAELRAEFFKRQAHLTGTLLTVAADGIHWVPHEPSVGQHVAPRRAVS